MTARAVFQARRYHHSACRRVYGAHRHVGTAELHALAASEVRTLDTAAAISRHGADKSATAQMAFSGIYNELWPSASIQQRSERQYKISIPTARQTLSGVHGHRYCNSQADTFGRPWPSLLPSGRRNRMTTTPTLRATKVAEDAIMPSKGGYQAIDCFL